MISQGALKRIIPVTFQIFYELSPVYFRAFPKRASFDLEDFSGTPRGTLRGFFRLSLVTLGEMFRSTPHMHQAFAVWSWHSPILLLQVFERPPNILCSFSSHLSGIVLALSDRALNFLRLLLMRSSEILQTCAEQRRS